MIQNCSKALSYIEAKKTVCCLVISSSNEGDAPPSLFSAVYGLIIRGIFFNSGFSTYGRSSQHHQSHATVERLTISFYISRLHANNWRCQAKLSGLSVFLQVVPWRMVAERLLARVRWSSNRPVHCQKFFFKQHKNYAVYVGEVCVTSHCSSAGNDQHNTVAKEK